MRKACELMIFVLLLAVPLFAQEMRLWVLREPGEMVEYDLTTFAVKNRVKLPPQALKSPANVSVNHTGQILLVPSTTPAVTEEDAAAPHTVWLWSGQAATTLEPGTEHNSEQRGSNQVVTESAPVAARPWTYGRRTLAEIRHHWLSRSREPTRGAADLCWRR